ncbi:MAG: hypothetical protein KTR29_12105 [Rhodothermaceae bacterium]|nr:hypothetical protein [Rhodothermaceae bacterium]
MITYKIVRTGLLALLMLFLCSEQAFAQNSKKRKTRISINTGGKNSYHWQNGRHVLKVEFEGELEWLDDDSGIKSMTRGSFLEIEEKTRNERHRLRVEAFSGNELEYSYRRNGKRQPYDEKAQEWFADVLPTFIRESGMGAESRAKRILGTDGVDGLLDEADLINSPGVKTLYMLYLFDLAELTGRQTTRAAQVASGISSPGDKSRFLKATAEAFLRYEEATKDYFDAVRSISSPGDKARVLIHLVEEDLLDETEPYILAVETARTISSPGDKARFMKAAVPFFVPDATEVYFETVSTISSPGDHARVLLSLLDYTELDDDSMGYLLRSARKISSPGDKARVLLSAATQMEDFEVSEDVLDVYLDVAGSVSTPGDRAKVLVHLYDSVEMGPSSVVAWLDRVRGISTPGDKARVLMMASDVVEDEDIAAAYFAVTKSVSIPGDRAKVLMHVFDSVEMSQESMLAWFEAVRTISTPGDKARALLKASDAVEDDDELVEAYIETAETVSTPGDRRRVLEALLD